MLQMESLPLDDDQLSRRMSWMADVAIVHILVDSSWATMVHIIFISPRLVV